MVRILQSIYDELSILTFPDWRVSDMSKNYHTKRQIKQILTIISGGNLTDMLKDILNETEMELICSDLVEALKGCNMFSFFY